MSMEDEQRILAIQMHMERLANAATLDEYASIADLVQLVAEDIMWMFGKLRQHEQEKNYYREELDMLLGRKISDQ